jgi:hypothetical protein
MSVAYTANHVYDPTPKMAETYGREVHEVTSADAYKLSAQWSLIQRAIAQRIEGTVHVEADRICVGNQIFAG